VGNWAFTYRLHLKTDTGKEGEQTNKPTNHQTISIDREKNFIFQKFLSKVLLAK